MQAVSGYTYIFTVGTVLCIISRQNVSNGVRSDNARLLASCRVGFRRVRRKYRKRTKRRQNVKLTKRNLLAKTTTAWTRSGGSCGFHWNSIPCESEYGKMKLLEQLQDVGKLKNCFFLFTASKLNVYSFHNSNQK